MALLPEITRALADESRLRILAALRRGELCACQIVELLGLAPSTTSRHLSQLRAAGLIVSRKSGRWIHYRLANADPVARSASSELVLSSLAWVLPSLEAAPCVAGDGARLDEILSAPADVIAARQRHAMEGQCNAPVE